MSELLHVDGDTARQLVNNINDFSFFEDSISAFSSLQDSMSTIDMEAKAFQTYYTAFTQSVFRLAEYEELVKKNCAAIQNAISSYEKLDSTESTMLGDH